MQYQRSGKRYQHGFESGEKVIESLFRFLTEAKIGHAAMIGIGALRHAILSYWNRDSQEYEHHELDEQMGAGVIEIWLRPERRPVRREFDESRGLYLMKLPKRL